MLSYRGMCQVKSASEEISSITEATTLAYAYDQKYWWELKPMDIWLPWAMGNGQCKCGMKQAPPTYSQELLALYLLLLTY